MGYRWFDTKNKPVMYPFGFGLGYSQIEYTDFSLVTETANQKSYKDGDRIMFTITLKNNGKYDQFDVPQVYVHRVDSKVEWPYKELKTFGKYKVPAGQSLNEGLIIPVEDLKYWDEEKHDWVLEPGKIELLLAHDAGNVVAKLEVEIR